MSISNFCLPGIGKGVPDPPLNLTLENFIEPRYVETLPHLHRVEMGCKPTCPFLDPWKEKCAAWKNIDYQNSWIKTQSIKLNPIKFPLRLDVFETTRWPLRISRNLQGPEFEIGYSFLITVCNCRHVHEVRLRRLITHHSSKFTLTDESIHNLMWE